ILGPNGSGKTTLIRTILGRLAPSAGKLEVFGRTPRRGDPTIGYVPQRPVFDPELSIRGRDFVELGFDGHRWGVRLVGRARAAGEVSMGTPAEIITTERLSEIYSSPVEVVRDSRGRVFVVGLEEEASHPHG